LTGAGQRLCRRCGGSHFEIADALPLVPFGRRSDLRLGRLSTAATTHEPAITGLASADAAISRSCPVDPQPL
jgi:hypothetical protein